MIKYTDILWMIAPGLLASCQNNSGGIKPEAKQIVEAVYASGFVVSRDEYEVISQAEGFVAEKLVEDGDLVKKGEALYVIESDQQAARNQIARETFELARRNYSDDSPVLKELKTALENSLTKMRFDSSNFARYSNLLKDDATTKAEFDRMKLAYESSRNEYALQQSRYQRTKNQLYLDLQNAKNNLIISNDEVGRYVIRSEADGRVFMTLKEEGELIRRSEVIAVVGKQDAYYIQLNVDELDVQRIREGQEILVKIDAYPEKIYRAAVSKIYPMVDRKQQAIRVDADLKEPLPGWFSGLSLEANIIINRKQHAIVIPKNSLLKGDTVIIETDDGPKKIKVRKGIETLDEVEIIEGLDTGHLLVNVSR